MFPWDSVAETRFLVNRVVDVAVIGKRLEAIDVLQYVELRGLNNTMQITSLIILVGVLSAYPDLWFNSIQIL